MTPAQRDLETASGRADRLMSEIGEAKQESYSRGEVRTILNSIKMLGDGVTEALAEAEYLRRGDVFAFRLVGGKVRPWIVLHVAGDNVSAVAMSSGDSAPGMVPSKCRLWPGSWIGTTVSLFNADDARRSVIRPYTNIQHLREIEARLHSIFGLRPIKGATA